MENATRQSGLTVEYKKMTHTIDICLINHSVEADDINSIKPRRFLYNAIIAMSIIAFTFIILVLTGWL